MIVQCKSCGTKFRFDETLIEGEGVWVRCSQCINVFFLDSPASVEAASTPDKEKGKGDAPRGISGVEEKKIFEGPMEDVKPPEKSLVDDIEKEIGDLDEDKIKDAVKAKSGRIHDEGETSEKEIGKKQVPTRGRQLVYLFILLLVGGVYLAFFSETGIRAVFEKILGSGQKSEEVGPAQVDLTDIRQRIINNTSLGIIRVVEGTAINQSSFPMTRIRVKGEITDAYTVVLGVRESYCGNLLTDDELMTMTEEQILKELSNPLGSDVSNDRITPKGQIPFMIVFTREQPGVAKTFVTPVGAERLLP